MYYASNDALSNYLIVVGMSINTKRQLKVLQNKCVDWCNVGSKICTYSSTEECYRVNSRKTILLCQQVPCGILINRQVQTDDSVEGFHIIHSNLIAAINHLTRRTHKEPLCSGNNEPVYHRNICYLLTCIF